MVLVFASPKNIYRWYVLRFNYNITEHEKKIILLTVGTSNPNFKFLQILKLGKVVRYVVSENSAL